ncbi:MAG TPA: SDR family oxidoreductase, partial [Gemmatimonadales bacterium]|nr:SDR family oxidoreductase [Gemmatimonadales bacterium]
VTGAGSGIGEAVARRLLAEGARVYAADLSRGAAPDGYRPVPLDVREEEDWALAMAMVLETAGRLDVLVNSVGISAASPIAETTLEQSREVMSTNLDGAFLATKHGIRAMGTGGGVIIHLGSASGIRPAGGAAAYSTSKAGLRMLVRTAAKECRDAGLEIRVNLVSPAGVKTPMWSSMPFFQALVREHGSEEAAYAALSAGGGGRFLEPDAVARVVVFLAGDDARHITGVELPVDEGWVL